MRVKRIIAWLGIIGFEQQDAAGSVDALVVGDHVYHRPTRAAPAIKGPCDVGYHPYVSATDQQTGQQVTLVPNLVIYVVAKRSRHVGGVADSG